MMNATSHPEKQRLADYVSGRLPETEATSVASHLNECRECETTIQAMESKSDTIASVLNQQGPADPYGSETELRRVVEKVAKLATTPGAAVPGAAVPGAATPGAATPRPAADKVSTKAPIRLGPYELLTKLGEGGMGAVFKARHEHLGKLVAIKVLPKKAMQDAAAVTRFRREMKAVGALHHPNIVGAHDAGEQQGVHFLVMEYVEGRDLSSLIKKDGPVTVEQAVSYMQQAAKGLAFAHAKNIVHRDIKPANLLVDLEGTVKILDLGLARLDDGSAADAEANNGLTQTGQVMGTVDYMAPEQAFDTHRADGKADVYSLGCTLYRILTGENAFRGDTVVQKILAHREQPIPSLTKLCPTAPAGLDALYQRMMAKQPEQRPTMAEVARELEAFSAKPQATIEAPPFVIDVQKPISRDPKGSARTAPSERAKPQATPVAGGRGFRPTRKLIAAGLGGFALVLAGVVFYIYDKDGKKIAEVHGPDGATVKIVVSTTPTVSAPPVVPTTSAKLTPYEILTSPDYEWTPPVNLGPTINASHLEEQPNLSADGLRLIYYSLGVGRPGLCEATRASIDEPFGPWVRLGPDFDYRFQTYGTTLSGDGLILVFVSDRPGGLGDRDLWQTTRPNLDSPFAKPVCLTALNSPGPEGIPTLSADGLSIWFSSRGRAGSPTDVYWTSRRASVTAEFESPVPYDPPQPPGTRSAPGGNWKTLSSDGRVLIYSMDKPNAELVMSVRPTSDAPFAAAVSLGPTINSESPEYQPTLSADGTTLVFVANRPDGLGESDLWMSRRVAKQVASPSAPPLVDAAVDLVARIDTVRDLITVPDETGANQWERRSDGLAYVSDGKFGKIRLPVDVIRRSYELTIRYTYVDGNPLFNVDLPLPAGVKVINSTNLQRPRLGEPAGLMCRVSYAENEATISAGPVDDLKPQLSGAPTSNVGLSRFDHRGTDTNTISLFVRQGSMTFHAIELRFLDEPAVPATQAQVPADLQFQQWLNEAAALPADKQLDAVAEKLMELNPGFDGKLTGPEGVGRPQIENGAVVGVGFNTDFVTNIAPVRVFSGLQNLLARGSHTNTGPRGKLVDLSPLAGMALDSLSISSTQVADISVLRGMPLTWIDLSNTKITDLTPLHDCKSLKSMLMVNQKIAPEQIAALQKALPDCKITWDDPNVFRPMLNEPDAERRVAVWITARGGKVKIGVNGKSREISRPEDLPPEPFVVGFLYRPKIQSPISPEEWQSLGELRAIDGMDLAGCRPTDEALAAIGRCTSLRSLIIAFDDTFGDAGLGHLAALSRLEYLDVGNCAMTAAGLEHLGKLTRLRGLQIGNTKKSLDLTSLKPLAGLQELENLGLNGTSATDAAVADLAALPRLRFLTLTGTRVTPAVIDSLLKMPRLCCVSLNGVRLTADALLKLAEHPMLSVVAVFGAGIKREEYDVLIPKLPRITLVHQDLQDFYADELAAYDWACTVGDMGLGHYGALRDSRTTMNLETSLNLMKPVAAEDLRRLAPLKNLVTLVLNGASSTDEHLRTLLESLKQHPHLSTFSVAGPQFTSVESLADLPRHADLINLHFGRSDALTDATAAIAAQLPQLRSVNYESSRLTDQVFESLAPLSNLRHVAVGDASQVTGARLGVLKKSPGLSSLRLDRCGIVDASLAVLAELPELDRLSLESTLVTDAGLEHLAGCRALRNLNLQQTKVTAAAVAELQQALPECRILWDGAK